MSLDGIKAAPIAGSIPSVGIVPDIGHENTHNDDLVELGETEYAEPYRDVVARPNRTMLKDGDIQLPKHDASHESLNQASGGYNDDTRNEIKILGGENTEGNDDLPQGDASTDPSMGQPHSVFPRRRRNFIVFMAALCAFISPLSGNIYFPALNPLSTDLHVEQSLINLSLTTYLIFQGLAPTFIGDLADNTGRRPAYIIGFSIYIGACIGLALQTSYPALLILRAIQAVGASSTIALASAVAADVATAAERGTYMGLVNGGALAGPALGPIIGGILGQFLGWRSIFWFLVILSGVIMVPLVLAFPETGRNVVGNGSLPPQPWNRDLLSVVRERRAKRDMSELNLENARAAREALAAKRKLKFPNPLSTMRILREKDVALLLFYNCLLYCSYYSVTSSLPYLFKQTYGFDELQVGLSFLPYGIGALLASLCNGRILDWRFRKVAKSINFVIVAGRTTDTRHFPLERVRFPIALLLLLIGNSALLCYGWVLQVQVPLAVPLVLLFIIGYCLNGGFNCCSVALVDYCVYFPVHIDARPSTKRSIESTL
ncbi:hypothetical protein MBLNU459_g3915t1 [Dothideomycetes sp. NU459]